MFADIVTSHHPNAGKSFSLHCPLESTQHISYNWVKYSTLDRSTVDHIPDDFVFSDNQRQWHVDWYEPHYNGLYECSLGNNSFYHDTSFFLETDCELTTTSVS